MNDEKNKRDKGALDFPADLRDAHPHSIRHRAEVTMSTLCGCFYCLRTYPPSEIVEWIDADDTALCPYCGIDSVLGDRSGYPMTAEFLARMEGRWFGFRK